MLNLVSLAFTLSAMASLMLALGGCGDAAAVAGAPRLHQRDRRAPAIWTLAGSVRAYHSAASPLIYRFGPSRREPRWQWLSVGSEVAAVAWLASSVLLSWYLGRFAHYDATYGSLGAAIGMMIWMWISAIVILFGAQFNSEIEHQTAH